MREQTLKTYPELTSILELLTGAINDQEMVAMNYQVEIEARSQGCGSCILALKDCFDAIFMS